MTTRNAMPEPVQAPLGGLDFLRADDHARQADRAQLHPGQVYATPGGQLALIVQAPAPAGRGPCLRAVILHADPTTAPRLAQLAGDDLALALALQGFSLTGLTLAPVVGQTVDKLDYHRAAQAPDHPRPCPLPRSLADW